MAAISMTTPRRNRMIALLGATAIAIPLCAGAAFAAEPAAPAATTPAGNDIIVTAQRRSERLEEVPMTVQVVSQETLSKAGVNTVRELANVTTGFQVGNSGSYPQPAIRGITTINAGAYENNVALFVDGLYQYVPQVLNMDLPNVQNIQVLKGPQSTLFGRNATGGAILIDTLDPTRKTSGQFEATYARFNDMRFRGYVAGPLSDSVGFSVAGTYRKTDGYYKIASRVTPGAFDGNGLGLTQNSIRAKLKFDLSPSFRATLGYSWLRASDPRGVVFTPIEQVATPYTGTANSYRPTGLGQVAGDVFQLDEREHEGSLKLEWDTGIGMLKSLTGYTYSRLLTDFDSGGTYAADNHSFSDIRDKVWQEALDYNLKVIPNVDLIVGGTYYNIKTSEAPDGANALFLAPAGAAPGTPISSYLKFQDIDFHRKKEAISGYIDATWHATSQLSINIGGRYSSETQDVEAQKKFYCTTAAGCTVGGVLIPVGGVTSTPYTFASSAQGTKYSKFTPRASIRYEISPRTNVYFTYSQGFRSGEWNTVPPSDTNMAAWKTLGQIGQESVDSFEIGAKTANSRFHAELSGFYYNYHNLQVSATSFDPNTGQALVSLQSIPKAKVYGVEGSFDYKVNDRFNVRGGATWLHARYGDGAVFIGTSVNVNGTGYSNNADPIRNLPNLTSQAQNLSGLQMSRAPNFTAFVGFDYKVPLHTGSLTIAGNIKYTDSYVVTNPSVWGGEPLASYECKNGTRPQTAPACASIPFVSTSYLPNNGIDLAGSPYAARASEQRARQSKYALVNASITWNDPTEHYYIRLWGNNLTDILYRQHYNPTGYSPIAEPRTYGGTMGYKF
ncbi:MAG: TonB-dependent receptor [Sphingomonadales bacterium]|nr:TonB-dependent receptor [Sphingomonadales bacterium]